MTSGRPMAPAGIETPMGIGGQSGDLMKMLLRAVAMGRDLNMSKGQGVPGAAPAVHNTLGGFASVKKKSKKGSANAAAAKF